ncbi:MAG: UDP-N-acetylmuramoyl-L-alanine--D-glutamate ligase, partial [Clostridia bacterium]|nr:UDP-N-acetylmuramoyl-L-alanine--D-glutamate ligase [Clostridia bacterium]
LDEFKYNVAGKNITVIGIGISNLPLIKYLVSLGANVTACDRRSAEDLGENYTELEKLGVKFNLGDGYLNNLSGDMIFKTPGMRYDVPELLKAKENGSIVTSEMEVFFEVCPSHIIAVTGSDGKTTTTTLIHKMMTDAGYKTWLGGNIGNPLLTDTEKMKENDWVILELSSFQLHTMRKSPEIAVITNISPNHLDMHKDYKEYIDAKKNIMLYQNEGDTLIVNADNQVTADIGKSANGAVKYFSRNGMADVYLDGNIIKRGIVEILNIKDIKIPGMHNVENYMAAIAAVSGLVSKDVIVNVAKTFGGVEHRIELVRTLDGVKYYNSSIDSSPNRTINTLRVFPNKVIIIAGGKDKGIPYDEIGPALAEHVKVLILIGATSDKIQEALDAEINKTGNGKDIEVIRATSYEDAVNTARSKAHDGDVVLLSPASTSFDMFRNFEERGNLFKKIVNELN